MENSITPLGELLLQIIEKAGKPVKRSEIAKAIERPGNQLNPHDKELLSRLAADGLIDEYKEKVGTVKTVWMYRIADGERK